MVTIEARIRTNPGDLAPELVAELSRYGAREVKTAEQVCELMSDGAFAFLMTVYAQTTFEIVRLQPNPRAKEVRKIKLTLPAWFREHFSADERQGYVQNLVEFMVELGTFTSEEEARELIWLAYD